MVSMKDIAQRCGVSVATVSKALNGQPDIGPETRDRICAAAEEMGYVTNAEPGHGLMKVKGYIIPFDATIPTDEDIYKLINTTPGRG